MTAARVVPAQWVAMVARHHIHQYGATRVDNVLVTAGTAVPTSGLILGAA
ncbi:hypothetical protein ABIC28_001261 [Rhodococcus sp. PvR044]|jgi:hypothetical protein|nr:MULTISPECIES: hypothetical protein [Rhodococcus]MCZ4555648.1 hypothetical protein [Rhodococcus maanshanensis]PTR38152.1 hypothetical protein C8K38_11842 [Rhodococcus sp. OK611]SNX93084.1 hypothetical protein SAMN05447004_11842 [Rhodococcus sp. OK270]